MNTKEMIEKVKKERIDKIQNFLKMNNGSIEGKEEQCIRYIDGMKENEGFALGSLGGKMSRLKSSIKKLNTVNFEV